MGEGWFAAVWVWAWVWVVCKMGLWVWVGEEGEVVVVSGVCEREWMLDVVIPSAARTASRILACSCYTSIPHHKYETILLNAGEMIDVAHRQMLLTETLQGWRLRPRARLHRHKQLVLPRASRVECGKAGRLAALDAGTFADIAKLAFLFSKTEARGQ